MINLEVTLGQGSFFFSLFSLGLLYFLCLRYNFNYIYQRICQYLKSDILFQIMKKLSNCTYFEKLLK